MNTWNLTKVRVLLALRNKTFIFFGLAMPLAFLFFFVLIFGHGREGWTDYILGSVLTITVMGSFWGLSVQLVMFREQGILRRFRLAPVGAGSLLASSILANYVLIVPTVAIEIIICRVAFHTAHWGNLGAMFALVTVGAATFSSFGLIVASVTNTMQETQVINNLLWSMFIFLSGATIPLAVFPKWIQQVALFSPATYLAMGLEAAATRMIAGPELIEELVALTVGMLVAFEVSRQLFRWEPEAKFPGKAKLWVGAALIPFLLFGIYEIVFGQQLSRIQRHYDMLNRQNVTSTPR
jgi:ABC-2 type transport system permease protein